MTGSRSGRSPVARRGTSSVIRVDRIRCDGYGMCAEMLPELIDLDDWGYPIIRPGGVSADLLTLARRAVDVCPVLALRLDVVTDPVASSSVGTVRRR
jgi:ferredoxin